MTEAMTFKFKFLDGEGREDSFMSKAGSLSPEGLVLGEESLPVDVVLRATLSNGSFILLRLFSDEGDDPHIGLKITSGSAADLVRAVNALASARLVKNRKAYLEEQGKGALFHYARCPYCRSSVDLSDLPRSEQTACVYCDRLFSPEGKTPEGEADFCLCGQCGYYGRVKERTLFYFYFLVVVWGYQSDVWNVCSLCMRKKAGWMLLANALFILGLPNALYQYFRCIRDIEFDKSEYAGLEKANGLAEKGKIDEAAAYYGRVTRRLALAAGAYYNLGRALAEKGQHAAAVEPLEKALSQCGNFFPAYHQLAACYEAAGMHEKLAGLHKRYGASESLSGEAAE